MSNNTFYISTPIYYVNGSPHIGTAYTTIAADVASRYKRMMGYDVHFLTGLDEHGQKVASTAAEHNMSAIEWCDSQVQNFVELWDKLNISNDDFIRTTQDRHIKGVQQLMQKIYDNGYLYKDTYEGYYCTPCETYFAQDELIDGKCPDCGRDVEFIKEENWFFKLSEFATPLLEYYESNPDFICPKSRYNEVLSFVKGGMHDLSASRSTFDWGVPLPFDESHVAYVWVDALINYITALGYGSDDESALENYWPADYHLVGKDIIRFHCVIWPAMLLAAGLPLPKHVSAHGFLMAADGSKMSKSKGNALYPNELIDIYGVDGYRYYFMSDVVFGNDANIGLERMTQVYNSDLANTYGNLFSRVSNMTVSYFDGFVPDLSKCDSAIIQNLDCPMKSIADGIFEKYTKALDVLDFCGASTAVMELLHEANLYIENSAPWNLAKDESKKDELAYVIYNGLETCRIAATYFYPFMPDTSVELLSRLSIGIDFENLESGQLKDLTTWGGLKAGLEVTKGAALFDRIKNK
ncbi:MAG: methionine--tRNA ligase [Coriobacteriales bacterium]|nr:methionine--tRNA ligase [Coriobacteriales bacterium]